MSNPVTISSVRFNRFKALRNYALSLHDMNILVGPNNSGKSTVISAFRALAAFLRIARVKRAQWLNASGQRVFGHLIRPENLPVSLENVHSDYDDTDTSIEFRLSNSNTLTMQFSADFAILTGRLARGGFPAEPRNFKTEYPITVSVIPVLGPLEHREKLLKIETVRDGLSTSRASRHFRNFWHHFPEGFSDFAELVRQTWPGMELEAPELVAGSDGAELSMWCRENRITRELFWSGSGFQIWCQLLTHIYRKEDISLMVLDEPEIYLHPDVQRQLVHLLRSSRSGAVVLATHSSEIMADADPSEIVLIDKKDSKGRRLADAAGIQQALDSIGSIQNVTLTHLARNRRVLFVEDYDDFRLLRLLARKLNFDDVASGAGVTVIKIDGFSAWRRIAGFAKDLERVLGAQLSIGVILDRDYFCPEELELVHSELAANCPFVHIHKVKEIENFLLVPSALDRTIQRYATKDEFDFDSTDVLEQLSADMKAEVAGQMGGKRFEYFRSSGRNAATCMAESSAALEGLWLGLGSRLNVVPGKRLLSAFREKARATTGANLTDSRIVESFRRDDFHPDINEVMLGLRSFMSDSR